MRFLSIRKLAFQIDTESTSKHYFTLYQIMKIKDSENVNKQIRKVLDMIFIFPLEPKEVFELIQRTKSTLIKIKKDSIGLLHTMNNELGMGKSLEEVVVIINSITVKILNKVFLFYPERIVTKWQKKKKKLPC